MSTNSIPSQVREFFAHSAQAITTSQLAAALGLETKPVSSAVSRLIKAGHLLRLEDGRVIRSTPVEETVEEPETAEETVAAEPTVEAEPVAEEAVTPRDLGAMKTKIAKLLALAERTENDEERDAFNDKAEHLMIQLGIARAELESVGDVKPEKIIEVVREWRGNYSIVMVPFVHDVALGFGNLTILQSTSSAMLRRTYIIGTETDVNEFCALIDSLALQVLSALRRWQKEHAAERRFLTDMEKYVQHRSFIAGFGQTVRSRLRATRTVEEASASTGAALVLASKADRIAAHLADAYPNMGKARGGMQQYSSVGAQAGRTAGQSANIGGKSVAGGKKSVEA